MCMVSAAASAALLSFAEYLEYFADFSFFWNSVEVEFHFQPLFLIGIAHVVHYLVMPLILADVPVGALFLYLSGGLCARPEWRSLSAVPSSTTWRYGTWR